MPPPGWKVLSKEEKIKLIAWRKVNVPVNQMARLLGRNKSTIKRFWQKQRELGEPDSIPERKKTPGSARPKKVTPQVIQLLKDSVASNPMRTAQDLKTLYPDDLGNVSVRTIQRAFIRDLNMRAWVPAKKPLLTERMIQKRIQFCERYRNWSEEDWEGVMFSDESTFRLIRGCAGVRRVRRFKGSIERYKNKHCLPTVKKSDSQMIWGCFSGKGGRAGLWFLPRNTTMRSQNYVECLQDHLLQFYEMAGCHTFLQDGAPCHTSRYTMNWINAQNINLIDWPGNSPDLNPIENLWSIMKAKLSRQAIRNNDHLRHLLKFMWVQDVSHDLCKKLARSMPRRIEMCLANEGGHTKY